MERLAKSTLPAGFGYEWTGTALQEKAASGQTGFILGLAVVFAYLFLVGLYESTAIPLAALLSVAVGLFGAVTALFVAGLDNNIYAQIGIVVLIALAAKNAILIIEFAMAERAKGVDVVTAATTAAGLRFRAVMMTLVRLHLRPDPAGDRLGRRRRHPARGRHRGVRRHDRGIVPRHIRDPGPLRRLPALPRNGQGLDGHQAAGADGDARQVGTLTGNSDRRGAGLSHEACSPSSRPKRAARNGGTARGFKCDCLGAASVFLRRSRYQA